MAGEEEEYGIWCILSPMQEKFTPPTGFAFTAGLFEATLLFVAVGAGWLVGISPLDTLHASVRAALIGSLAALPAVGIMIVCILWPGRWFSQLRTVVDEMLIPLFRQLTLAEMAIISFLAGLGKEVLFRGVFQAALARWLGGSTTGAASWGGSIPDWTAAGVVALLFGLAHSVNFGYALLAAGIGLYLGWLWMASGDLTVPIAAHAVYDFLALVYLVKIRDRNDQAD